jgi:lactate permease
MEFLRGLLMWIQNYDPLNNIWLSALVALIPIIVFFVTLVGFKLKGYLAGLITVITALAVALFFYKMPVAPALASMGNGFLYGMWPIAWIILTSVFLYKLSVKTGYFEVIRASIMSITKDHRLLVVLIAFSFGAFLEGAAGHGAPVAISAALLVGLGIQPLYAAGLSLIANTAPVAFGALGIPVTTSAALTGIPANELGVMIGHQLPLMSLLVPFFIVWLMDGFKGIRETWPGLLVAGGAFAISQFLTPRLLGPELPDITSALASMVALAVFLKFWQPKHIYTTPGFDDRPVTTQFGPLNGKLILKAWSPFLILTAMVVVWSQGAFKALFAADGVLHFLSLDVSVPFLDGAVAKTTPIVSKVTPYPAVYHWEIVAATGTAILLSALLSVLIYKMPAKDAWKVFTTTAKELVFPILTIGFVLSFAYLANYSGLSSTLALALSKTGYFFPILSPVLGWLGVFLTGSDTSSNALFSNLQATTAHQIGVKDTLLVAANSTGGVTGKMISPQSIAVATAAVGLQGQESKLLRYTFWKSILFLAFISLLTYLQAYFFTWMIP